MAKQYIVKFSDSKEIIPTKNESGNESLSTKANLEITMMRNIFNVAAMHQKEIGKYLQCKDCISQLDNLKTGTPILLTEEDLKYFTEGFEKTVGGRPFFWIEQCENIFRQVKNPVEFKEEEKK